MQTQSQIDEQNKQNELNKQNAQKQPVHPGQPDSAAPYGRDGQGNPKPRP